MEVAPDVEELKVHTLVKVPDFITSNCISPSSLPSVTSVATVVIRAYSVISSASLCISKDRYISSLSALVVFLPAKVATLLLALLVVLATNKPPCVLAVSFLIANSSTCNLSLPLLYLIEDHEVIFTS